MADPAEVQAAQGMYGPGIWRGAMNGDVDGAERVWQDCPPDASAALDVAYMNNQSGKVREKRVTIPGLIEGQDKQVDFQFLTTMHRNRDRNVVIPLIRFDRASGRTSLPQGRHPWKQRQIARKEDESKAKVGPGEQWLTNEFFVKAFKKAIGMDGGDVNFDEDEIFDFRWNEDYRDLDPSDPKYERRGGVLYKVPAGWKRFSLRVKDKYDDGDNTWMMMNGRPGEWGVAYHGTAMKIVPMIVKGGFRVGSGQGAVNCDDVRTGNKTGSGVFCTPNLTPVECYANGNEDGGSEQKTAAACVDGHTLFFAFQCRVNPKAIRRPDRHFSRNNDEETMGIDGVFEWVVNDPKDIRPYGILVRDKAKCDHRTLGQLIGGGAWNKEHKCMPWNSFGRIDPEARSAVASEAELKRSYDHAKKACP